jgi:hypothetical protein
VRDGKRINIPSQLDDSKPAQLYWVLSGQTPANTKRTFELVSGQSNAQPSIQAKKTDTGLDLIAGQQPILHYQSAIMPPPAGKSPRFARGGFIHPLYTPSGALLTRIHAPDHIHHMGLWNPWTSTEFEGRHVDFWNIGDGTGTVRFVKFLSVVEGPVFTEYSVLHEHVDLSAPGGEKVAISEVQKVRVYTTSKDQWLIDFTTQQRCASSSPIKLLQYRYGGLGYRGPAEWNANNSNYLTSEGKTRKDGHATRARWCNCYGETTKGPAGVLFLSHPQNHEHPEPMRIWPEGMMFFNFTPIQASEWVFEPGNEYVLNYRLCAYDGKRTAEQCQSLWSDFAQPPTVSVQK